MLQTDDVAGLEEFCAAMHPARAAEFMEGLTAAETWAVLRATDPERRTAIFQFLDQPKQVEILETADREETSVLIAEMASDDRVDLLKQVEPETVEGLLPLIPTEERRDITRLSQYPEGTAGALMTTNVARLPESLTVWQALEEIAHQARDHETIYYIYIIDSENHLRGLISARQLVTYLRTPETPISELMQRDLVTVEATDDQEAVAAKVADYNFLAIPVVDSEHHLVGIITHDDVMDVLREEATEDALRMAGINPMPENYLEAPFTTVWRKRSAWLSCLFIAELFTFTALAYFESSIAALLVLSLFVPLCISTGGNSGSQAATLITRAMALGHIGPKQWWRVLRHEVGMGVVLGLTLGVIGFLRVAFTPQHVLDSTEHFDQGVEVRVTRGTTLLAGRDGVELPVGAQIMKKRIDKPTILNLPPGGSYGRVDSDDDHDVYQFSAGTEVKSQTNIRWQLAAVIGLSVAAICLWGTLIGSMLPLLFSAVGFDPGYASSPFVATFVDVTGIIIFFSIAHLWLL